MRLRVLQKPWQFRKVYRDGKKVDCAPFASVFYVHSGEAEPEGPRFGFVASRRLGGAVRRNRAKRLLREVARRSAESLGRSDLWVVFVARPGILSANYQDLLAEVQHRMTDEGLIAGDASS